jgi:hypothetical protein
MKSFYLKKQNDVEVKERCQVKISNRCAALENLNDDDDDDDDDEVDMDIDRAQESVRGNMKALSTERLGYYELKQHKPLFVEECSKLLEQRKQAKLQWLQNPSETNGDNLKNVRRENGRTFRNKKRKRVKEKINELEADSKIKKV